MATAIEEDLFEVYYQPLYDLKEKRISYNGSIKPIETSVTWNDLTSKFLSELQRNMDRSQSLGIFNYRKVCKFNKRTSTDHRKRLESIKYNLSPLELIKIRI